MDTKNRNHLMYSLCALFSPYRSLGWWDRHRTAECCNNWTHPNSAWETEPQRSLPPSPTGRAKEFKRKEVFMSFKKTCERLRIWNVHSSDTPTVHTNRFDTGTIHQPSTNSEIFRKICYTSEGADNHYPIVRCLQAKYWRFLVFITQQYAWS